VQSILHQIAAHRLGPILILVLAAFLEAAGDSYFQSGLYRTSGAVRVLSFAGGAAMLVLYGLLVNLPRWEFGRLLGVYVVLVFLMAQFLAKVRFHQSPTPPILVGGSLIVIGGLVITFWKG
jgi:small multidrug resistance family-3 protein